MQGSPGHGGGVGLAEGRPGVLHSVSCLSQSLSAPCLGPRGLKLCCLLIGYQTPCTPLEARVFLGHPPVSGGSDPHLYP